MAQITKASRQYVALSHYEVDVYTHKPRLFVVAVSQPGSDSAVFEYQSCLLAGEMDFPSRIYNETVYKNLFVVTLAACKRSYSAAWRAFSENDTQGSGWLGVDLK